MRCVRRLAVKRKRGWLLWQAAESRQRIQHIGGSCFFSEHFPKRLICGVCVLNSAIAPFGKEGKSGSNRLTTPLLGKRGFRCYDRPIRGFSLMSLHSIFRVLLEKQRRCFFRGDTCGTLTNVQLGHHRGCSACDAPRHRLRVPSLLDYDALFLHMYHMGSTVMHLYASLTKEGEDRVRP